MFLDKLFSAWALSNLAVTSAVAVDWYANKDNEDHQLWDQLASPSSFQCCTAVVELYACFEEELPDIVRQFMSADATYLAQYDSDYFAWQSACSRKQSYAQFEGIVLPHMRWKLLDLAEVADAATSTPSGFENLVAQSIQRLKQNAELSEAGAWGPKNKVHCVQILTTEVLHQLTRMYGLELELATPHQRVDGWLRNFLLVKCQANSVSDLATNHSLCHEIALWYQVTVVSTEDTQEAMNKVEALRVGAVDSLQSLSLFKGRFEALQDQWIRFVHLFGLNAWPMYNQYKDVAERFVDQETGSFVVLDSKFMRKSFSIQSSQFYSAVIAALPHMYWLKWKNFSSTFFLARLLSLLATQEPSLCKGFLCYASAIMAMDFSQVYLNHVTMLTGNLVYLLEHLMIVVHRHTADYHSLLHTLYIRMPKKWVNKRKLNMLHDNIITLSTFVHQCALPEARRNAQV